MLELLMNGQWETFMCACQGDLWRWGCQRRLLTQVSRRRWGGGGNKTPHYDMCLDQFSGLNIRSEIATDERVLAELAVTNPRTAELCRTWQPVRAAATGAKPISPALTVEPRHANRTDGVDGGDSM